MTVDTGRFTYLAHSADALWQPEAVDKAEKLVQRWNLKLLEKEELPSPFR